MKKEKGFKLIDHLHGVNYTTSQLKLSSKIEDESDFVHFDIPQTYSKANLLTVILTLYLLYFKFSDNLMITWQASFYLIYLILIYNFAYAFYNIISDSNTIGSIQSVFKDQEEVIGKIENLMLLSNLVNLIHYTLCFFSCYFFAQLMDTKDDSYIFYILTTSICLCINQLLFSLLADSSWFKIKNTANENITDSGAFLASLLTPIATYISNMTLICSANSGVCTQFYLSTLTSILGAFGITVSNLSQYLFPITIVMLIVSNISLYIKRKKLSHPPFLLGLVSTAMILLSKLNEESLWYLMYLGNILMLIAAIWNMRMNKFYGLPSKAKQKNIIFIVIYC